MRLQTAQFWPWLCCRMLGDLAQRLNKSRTCHSTHCNNGPVFLWNQPLILIICLRHGKKTPYVEELVQDGWKGEKLNALKVQCILARISTNSAKRRLQRTAAKRLQYTQTTRTNKLQNVSPQNQHPLSRLQMDFAAPQCLSPEQSLHGHQ